MELLIVASMSEVGNEHKVCFGAFLKVPYREMFFLKKMSYWLYRFLKYSGKKKTLKK